MMLALGAGLLLVGVLLCLVPRRAARDAGLVAVACGMVLVGLDVVARYA